MLVGEEQRARIDVRSRSGNESGRMRAVYSAVSVRPPGHMRRVAGPRPKRSPGGGDASQF
jgi:hypothetical protein